MIFFKPKPKKTINFLYTDWHGNRIRGKLILVNNLSLGDKFICIQLYNMFSGRFPINLTPANTDDVKISANNKIKYYIFKPS